MIEDVAIWSCENEDLLNAAQGVAVATAVVAGMIIIAPALGVGAGVIVGGAALGGALSLWTCDQSDNGFLRPSLDLDTTCVATEIALGAVFAPIAGAVTGSLARRVAVACGFGALEGGTSTVAHMTFVDEDQAFDATDALVGAGIGCVAAGVIGAPFGPQRVPDVAPSVRSPRTPALVEIDNNFPTRAQRVAFLDANGNTIRRGNFGEMSTDQAMRDLDLPGFRVVHQTPVTDIDAPIRNGIDHVFAYVDTNGVERFVIVETKFSLDGLTQTTTSTLTADGRQMSNTWLLGSNRLLDQVSTADEAAIRVAITSGRPIDRVLASVDIGGNVQFRNLDSGGIGLPSGWIPDIG